MAGRWLSNFVRGFWVWVVISSFAFVYALRRLGTLTISDPVARKARVAEIQGRMLRAAMAFLGACFVKLGQVMSSRPDLFEPEMIAQLRHLQDNMPPFPFAVVKRTIEGDLGKPLSELFLDFEERPIAAASVAQVHRAHLKDGREVAVKVLRPSVRAQVERDGTLLLAAAKLLSLHPTIRLSDPLGFTRSFVEGLIHQTDLRREADNYTQFRKNFEDEPRVSFPEVYPELSRERVLVMAFVRGVKLDQLGPGDHSQIATTLREAAFKMCLTDGFVHADMHPGNMVKRDDGVLVFFDVGLATRMAPNSHEMFIDMTKCVAMGTTDDMINHFKRYHLYLGEVDWAAMRADIDAFAGKFRGQDVSQLDYGEMVNEMLAIGRRYHVRPMSDLALVIVGTVTAQGIGKMLCPQVNDFVEMSKFLIPILTKRGEKVPDSDAARHARTLIGPASP